MWELADALGGGLPCELPQAPGVLGVRQTPGLQQPRRRTGLGAGCLMGALPATSLQSGVLLLGETLVLACLSGMPLSDSGEIPQ